MRTHKALACVALMAAGAATAWALPWSQDMVRSRAVAPQTLMLEPPPNTLAVGHPRIMDRVEADERLTNPLAASPEVLKQGRTLFDTYCTVCHGPDGHTVGPLGKYFEGMPELSVAAIQAYSDGWMYSVIREGGFAMPGYAEMLSPQERWVLVHFVRTFR